MSADHSHGSMSWQEWLRRPGLVVVSIAVGVALLATIIGLVGMWPDGSGTDRARAQAREVGLTSERFEARVDSVTDAPCSYPTEDGAPCRSIVVIPREGPDEGALVGLGEYSLTQRQFSPDVEVGDRIVVGYEPSTSTYFFADMDRRAPLVWLVVVFAVVVIALARWRGVFALAGMAATLVLLVAFVAPAVLDGHDPLVVSIVAASAIAFFALYLTHGFSPTTTIALAGTLSALVLTLGLSWVFFRLARFSGVATEEGLLLPFIAGNVPLSSLVLGGAVLGALGALDDVTVTQVATVDELHRHSPSTGVRALTRSGIRVGREHIAATVNTLLLAYVGASMPLLLLFAATDQSLVQVANSEVVAVEIFRTLCGSVGLVAAVPVTTALAAAVLGGRGHEDPQPTAPPVVVPEATDRDGASTDASTAAGDEPVAPPEASPPSWSDFAPRDDLEL